MRSEREIEKERLTKHKGTPSDSSAWLLWRFVRQNFTDKAIRRPVYIYSDANCRSHRPISKTHNSVCLSVFMQPNNMQQVNVLALPHPLRCRLQLYKAVSSKKRTQPQSHPKSPTTSPDLSGPQQLTSDASTRGFDASHRGKYASIREVIIRSPSRNEIRAGYMRETTEAMGRNTPNAVALKNTNEAKKGSKSQEKRTIAHTFRTCCRLRVLRQRLDEKVATPRLTRPSIYGRHSRSRWWISVRSCTVCCRIATNGPALV